MTARSDDSPAKAGKAGGGSRVKTLLAVAALGLIALILWSRSGGGTGTAADFNRRGLAKAKAGDAAGAIADFNRAVELEPEFADAYFNRAVARSRAGNADGAIDDYAAAVRHSPRNFKALVNRGRLLRDKGELKGALREFTQAVAVAPDDPNVRLNRGIARIAVRNFEGAMDDLNAALERSPDSPDALWHRARARRALGDVAGADSDRDKALAAKPALTGGDEGPGAPALSLSADDDKLFIQAAGLRLGGNPKKALELLDEVIAANPKNAELHYHRGRTRHEAGDGAGALADFDKTMELKPDHAAAIGFRGVVFLSQRREADAKFAIAAAIKLRRELHDMFEEEFLKANAAKAPQRPIGERSQ